MSSKFVYIKHKVNGNVHQHLASLGMWDGYEAISQTEGKKLYREQEIKALRKRIKAGGTVYVNVNSVSSSGMSRRMSFFIVEKGQISRITYSVGIILDWSVNDTGVQVSGCGMDMCFHAVYCLSRCLFPKGFKTKEGAQQDGGYALKYSQL